MAKNLPPIEDFAVAPRRSRVAPEVSVAVPAPSQEEPAANDIPLETSAPKQLAQEAFQRRPERPASTGILSGTPEERRERATARAVDRETAAVRLRDLRRARDRQSKHYVNVPLDYDTKKRLERAASENDVKMTVIMQAAIDQFLRENDY